MASLVFLPPFVISKRQIFGSRLIAFSPIQATIQRSKQCKFSESTCKVSASGVGQSQNGQLLGKFHHKYLVGRQNMQEK
jgi:hypothetical protein